MKNKNILLIMVIGLFLVSFASAYEPHKQNTDLYYSFTSNNATQCNVTTANTPNGTITINQITTKSGQTFSSFIGAGNFTILGTYIFNIVCTDGSQFETGDFGREITYIGKDLAIGESILYIGFLTLMILLFVINFVAIGYLPARNERDEEGRIMSISYLKYFRNVLALVGYFLFIAIFYMSSNLAFAFLQEELFAKTLFMIFRVSFLLAPVVIVVWVIWIFASMFHDKQFQRVLNRGMFPGGRI